MKTFEMFMEQAPQRLKMSRLYHGTDKSASDSIDKSGYDTSKGENKLAGDGIYVTKKQKTASDYAKTRANQRGSSPVTKEFLVPKDQLGTKRAKMRKGKPVPSKSDKVQKVDMSNYLMKDSQANKYSTKRQPVIRRKKS